MITCDQVLSMTVNWNRSVCISLAVFMLAACDNTTTPSPSAATSPAPATSAPPVITKDNYTVGSLVEFKTGGNSEPYRVSGWSHTEAEFTWTEGQSAVLSFSLPPNPGPLLLTMKLAGFINPPELLNQRVEVHLNQQKIAEWEVGETAEFEAEVPAALTEAGPLTLELRMPQATSPKAIGKSQDRRVLGACVYNLTFIRP